MVAGRGGRAWGTPEPVSSPHPTPTPRSEPHVPHPPPSSISTTEVKKSDHVRHRQLLGSSSPTMASLGLEPRPPHPTPRPDLIVRRQPAITTREGGLTDEATVPPPPSVQPRESSLAPPRLGEASPPRSAASGEHGGFWESSCRVCTQRPPGRGARATWVKTPETQTTWCASSSTLHPALCRERERELGLLSLRLSLLASLGVRENPAVRKVPP